MKKEFIPYEQALEVKVLGFDEACICYYDIEDSYKLKPTPMKEEVNAFHFNSTSIMVAAPLYQQAFRWFREKYNLRHSLPSRLWNRHSYSITDFEDFKDEYDGSFTTYEEAELACLKKLIEIAKNK
jgi:hypothetical protein